MNELWVARDADGAGWLFDLKPTWVTDEGVWACDGSMMLVEQLPATMFPNLRPGECKRLVMAEESSE